MVHILVIHFSMMHILVIHFSMMHVSVMHIYPWCMYPYASKVLNILGTQPLQICNFQTSWATFTVCLFGFYNETYDCPTFESRLVSRLAQSQIRVAITCNIWLSHFVCLLEYIFCSIYLLEYITLWQCHSCSYLYTITDQTGNHMQDLTVTTIVVTICLHSPVSLVYEYDQIYKLIPQEGVRIMLFKVNSERCNNIGKCCKKIGNDATEWKEQVVLVIKGK